MNLNELNKAAIAAVIGGSLLKFGNENYEMLKSSTSLIGPLACLIGGGALLYQAFKSFGRSFIK